MNGLADVISLDSRRRRPKRRDPRPAQASSPVSRRRRVALVCAGVLTLMTGLVLVDHSARPGADAPSPVLVPAGIRQGLYQRALDDLNAACLEPEAHTGLLRQHCVDQAKFLSALPECTADCTHLTSAVLTLRR
jgi:hypothetical protein